MEDTTNTCPMECENDVDYDEDSTVYRTLYENEQGETITKDEYDRAKIAQSLTKTTNIDDQPARPRQSQGVETASWCTRSTA